jgi:dihydrolipoamide dehydrogenase
VILGGGPGGYAAALYANNFGLDVTMVEKERPGGTCLIRGCIPAKQWLHIAEVYSTVSHAAEFGVNTSEPEIDWQAALARKNDSRETGQGSRRAAQVRGRRDVTGFGRLAGPDGKVEVETDDGTRTVEGDKVILASGSYARTIPGYEIDGDKIVTSDHALDWESQPRRVGIIGGGVIGCEFASYLIDLGTEVHVFEMMDQIVPGTDAETARMLQRQLQKRGVKFNIGVEVGPRRGGRVGGDPVRRRESRGRRGPGGGGSGPQHRGRRARQHQGRARPWFVEGRPRHHGDRRARSLCSGRHRGRNPPAGPCRLRRGGRGDHPHRHRRDPAGQLRRHSPGHLHPPGGRRGGDHRGAGPGARSRGRDHQALFNGIGRAIIIGQNQGFAKVVALKDGPIVGASVVGPQAGELIHELMYSVGWEALPSEAAAFIHAHPTLSETVGETLMSAAGRSLH